LIRTYTTLPQTRWDDEELVLHGGQVVDGLLRRIYDGMSVRLLNIVWYAMNRRISCAFGE
jgi:hypothetical protein